MSDEQQLTVDDKISIAIASLSEFYAPRVLWLMDAVAYLVDDARPRAMSSGDTVRIQRMSLIDSRLKSLNEDFQRRTNEFVREETER